MQTKTDNNIAKKALYYIGEYLSTMEKENLGTAGEILQEAAMDTPYIEPCSEFNNKKVRIGDQALSELVYNLQNNRVYAEDCYLYGQFLQQQALEMQPA